MPLPPDPDPPTDFEVTSWSSSSISLAWDCPDKFSSFLLTVFYLDGADHVTEEVLSLQKEDHFAFVLSDLEPCTRVKFGLQTVCQAGVESRYSRMRLNNGNSGESCTNSQSGRDGAPQRHPNVSVRPQ